MIKESLEYDDKPLLSYENDEDFFKGNIGDRVWYIDKANRTKYVGFLEDILGDQGKVKLDVPVTEIVAGRNGGKIRKTYKFAPLNWLHIIDNEE